VDDRSNTDTPADDERKPDEPTDLARRSWKFMLQAGLPAEGEIQLPAGDTTLSTRPKQGTRRDGLKPAPSARPKGFQS
jgi:hypothetical protein